MPVTIKLNFPAGRYHATPWGRHVNEGVAEWPPSPWRLLRALIAVWKRTCPDISDLKIKRVLTALVNPPRFKLPRHHVAHTRHYMPWEKKGPADRTLVFDTFVSVSRLDALFVYWPDAELNADDLDILKNLLANLTSLGRAEGWVHAELTEYAGDWNCVATDTDADPVPVLCPDPVSAFDSKYYPIHDPKKLAKGKVNPKDFLFDCPRWHLCLDTETIHEKKWPLVPGAKWVNYARPADCPPPKLAVRRNKLANSSRYATARFALDAAVLPLVADTLPFAEIARSCIMGQYQRLRHRRAFGTAEKPYRQLFRSPVFSGKDADGEHLLNHGHAYYVPADEDGDGRIDHLTVYAEDGFGPDEVAALYGVRSLPVGEGEGVRVILVGLGQRGDFTAALFQRSSSWQSATPFLVSRYLKKRGRKKDPAELREAGTAGEFVRVVLLEELGRLRHRRPEVPEPARVEFLPEGRMGAHRLRPIQFKRFRRKPGDDGGNRPSGAFRIVFPEPVAGPICLGHSCHFGMGLFVPCEE